jgi:hypothetical protein
VFYFCFFKFSFLRFSFELHDLFQLQNSGIIPAANLQEQALYYNHRACWQPCQDFAL